MNLHPKYVQEFAGEIEKTAALSAPHRCPLANSAAVQQAIADVNEAARREYELPNDMLVVNLQSVKAALNRGGGRGLNEGNGKNGENSFLQLGVPEKVGRTVPWGRIWRTRCTITLMAIRICVARGRLNIGCARFGRGC